MISSGVTNEKSIRKFAPVAFRPFHLSRPIANATPKGTEISIVSVASLRLWDRAVRRLGSRSTERSGSPVYQRSENPCHVLRERPESKLNRTASATGARDQ